MTPPKGGKSPSSGSEARVKFDEEVKIMEPEKSKSPGKEGAGTGGERSPRGDLSWKKAKKKNKWWKKRSPGTEPLKWDKGSDKRTKERSPTPVAQERVVKMQA